MAITWTQDKTPAAITDTTELGKITNAYQAAWRNNETGKLGALGPVGFCSMGDHEKAVEAAKKVAEFLSDFSAMALSSLHLVPLYNKNLLDNPDLVPDDPGVDNPNVSFQFKVYESGNSKPHKTSVYLPRAIIADADAVNYIGTELQDMFNGRAQVSTSGQPDYVAPYTKLLPTGFTCRFVGAKSGTDK